MSEIQTKLCLAWFIACDTVPHTTEHRYKATIVSTALENLAKIGQGNLQAINTLISILESLQSQDMSLQSEDMMSESCRSRDLILASAAESLGEIGQSDPRTIAVLIHALRPLYKNYFLMQKLATRSLIKIGINNSNVINQLVNSLQSLNDQESSYWWEIIILEDIGKRDKNVIKILKKLLLVASNNNHSYSHRIKLASALGKVEPGNSEAYETLIEIFISTQNLDAIKTLTEILEDKPISLVVAQKIGDYFVNNISKKMSISKKYYETIYAFFYKFTQIYSYGKFYEIWNNSFYAFQAVQINAVQINDEIDEVSAKLLQILEKYRKKPRKKQ